MDRRQEGGFQGRVHQATVGLHQEAEPAGPREQAVLQPRQEDGQDLRQRQSVLSVWPSSSASTSHNSSHLKICLYFHHTLINSQIRQKSSSQNHESSLNYSRSDERRGKPLS